MSRVDAMRIGRQHDSRAASPLRRKSVPDYTQRSTKLRLFVIVAALMIVVAFADRARDPKTRSWLWQGGNSANVEPKFTNRLQQKPLRTAFDPQGTFVSEDAP